MKVIGISGSRRKKGNTATLIKKALQPFENSNIETELIFLDDYQIQECTGCEECKDCYQCVINDDMQQIYPKLMKADAIILGSPTYFYNISSITKAFIDRCYCFEFFAESDRSIWVGLNEIIGIKYATVIAVCEQTDEKYMGFTAEAMTKPLKSLGYRVVDKIKILNLFKENDASGNKIALKQAYNGGKRLLKTLELRYKLENNIKNI